jgi:hypothetical protein
VLCYGGGMGWHLGLGRVGWRIKKLGKIMMDHVKG